MSRNEKNKEKNPVSRQNKASSGNEKIKQNKTGTKKLSPTGRRFLTYLMLIIIAGIIGVVIAGIKFFGKEKTQRNASISIEFTYDGAAQNLTPSGELFSIDGIYQERVLKAALEEAGLADRYTVESIQNSLIVNGSYPGDVIDKIKEYDSLYDFSESRSVSINNYYPTIYTLSLYDDFDTSVSESSLKSLVKAIAEKYKEYFSSEYIFAYDVTTENNLLSSGDYDYSQRVKILKQHLSMLKTYAQEMYEEDATFRYNGKSFNDIVLKCREIENDSLSNAEASIIIDVLTTSSTRLRNQYEYEIKLLENEKKYKEMNLTEINALIESYEMDGTYYIGSGDSLVKIDSNSKATYEELIDKKRELSERLVEIDSEIARYNEYLEDMKKGVFTSTTTAAKKDLINSELERIAGLVSEQQENFKAMTTAYNGTILSEDAVLIENQRYNSAKLFSAGFIVMAVKCAAPICIVIMILCSLHAALCEIKRYKKEIPAKET